MKKKDTSALVDAATAFDDALRAYGEVARSFLKASLSSARQLERIEETLGEIAACEERLTETGSGLAKAVAAARDEQERTAQAMIEHLPLVKERMGRLKALFTRFQELGAAAAGLNSASATASGPAAARELADQLLALAERAEEVAKEARDADFGDLATQAHALHQQMLAAHRKLVGAAL